MPDISFSTQRMQTGEISRTFLSLGDPLHVVGFECSKIFEPSTPAMLSALSRSADKPAESQDDQRNDAAIMNGAAIPFFVKWNAAMNSSRDTIILSRKARGTYSGVVEIAFISAEDAFLIQEGFCKLFSMRRPTSGAARSEIPAKKRSSSTSDLPFAVVFSWETYSFRVQPHHFWLSFFRIVR